MSDRPHVVCSDIECRFEDRDLARIREVADVTFNPDLKISTLERSLRNADILVASCFAKIPKAVFRSASGLRAVIKYGVGVDNIAVAAAEERGIVVLNCPDYGSATVAEFALALLLNLARRISLVDHEMRNSGWMWPSPKWRGTDIAGKTVGIVGFGRIGREFAKRIQAFDTNLVVYSPYTGHDDIRAYGATAVTFDDLLTLSDIISIHCTLNAGTRHLFDARALARMKRTALLINVSRGEIVDEVALINALESNQIAGAGLDVFEVEPLADSHPLLGFENVVLAPHFAWFTAEAAARQSRQATAAVLDVLAARAPQNRVRTGSG